ncbi:MAG: carbohydrate ABC transporter permease [Devosia sp.]|nr:carbohydrate ABC transporter permease [Devosia sp.]
MSVPAGTALAAPRDRTVPPANLRSWGIARWLVTLALVIVAVVSLYPLIFTVVNSFKTRAAFAQDPLGFVADITFENYVDTFFRMNVPRLLFNSVVTTAGGLLLSTLAALFLAYAVTKLKVWGSNFIFLFIIAMLVIPSQVVIYPLYETILDLGFGGTYQGLILAYGAFGLPISTYMLAAYFRSIPGELIEAARMDGAGDLRILFQILLPISTPAIAALSILNFVWMWNDLLLPLVIMGGSEKTTLMVGVALLSGQYDVSIPLISAGLIVALLPVMVVYFLFQRQILSGAVAGAVR